MKSIARKMMLLTCLVCMSAALLIACSPARSDKGTMSAETNVPETPTPRAAELQISADEAFTRALLEVQQLYNEEHPNITFKEPLFTSTENVENTKAKAAALSSSKEKTLDPDIVITGDSEQMDLLEKDGGVDPGSWTNMHQNRLVIVTSEKNKDIMSCSLSDIVNGEYVCALGDKHVMSGDSSRAVLTTVGAYSNGSALTDNFIEEPKTEMICEDVSEGTADVAILYTTDIYRYGSLKIVGQIEAGSYPPIVYHASDITRSDHSDEAREFIAWCKNDTAAQDIFLKWGFLL